jgi:hypothetical protein
MRADREGLLAAARVIAGELKKYAGAVSRQAGDAVNVSENLDGTVFVNAGRPAGRWGWHPIQAWMFETGSAHPLFGDRGHWYNQPHRPFLDAAANAGADRAAEAYAEKEVERLRRDYGFI